MDFMKEIWATVLDKLTEKYSELTVRLWFGDLMLTQLDENNAYISVESEFKRDMIMKKYGDEIKRQLDECLGFPVKVILYVRKTGEQLENDEPQEEEPEVETSQPNSFCSEFTFENFVVGSSNKLTHAACTAVALWASSDATSPMTKARHMNGRRMKRHLAPTSFML